MARTHTRSLTKIQKTQTRLFMYTLTNICMYKHIFTLIHTLTIHYTHYTNTHACTHANTHTYSFAGIHIK